MKSHRGAQDFLNQNKREHVMRPDDKTASIQPNHLDVTPTNKHNYQFIH